MSEKKKLTPKALVCYKEGRTQKWVMTTQDNHEETLLNILTNSKVVPHSVFLFPTEGLLFGGIWVDPWGTPNEQETNNRFSIWKFFEKYDNRLQPKFKSSEKIKEVVKKIEEEKEIKSTTKYGFISPDGKFFECEFEGHHNLAYNICFGQYNTNTPEQTLLEKGWCKIYNPMQPTHRQALYMEDGFKLTDAQFKTLQYLKLDSIKFVSLFL